MIEMDNDDVFNTVNHHRYNLQTYETYLILIFLQTKHMLNRSMQLYGANHLPPTCMYVVINPIWLLEMTTKANKKEHSKSFHLE